MDQLEAMRSFVRVADLGSFSAVAHQAGVARSVITRQVASLEARLGARLMTRSTRRLALTSAGAAYLEKSRAILAMVEAAESEIAEDRGLARGHVKISVPLSFGLARLAPMLLDFAARHPEVTLEMDYADRRVDLIEEGFDLSIRITRELAPSDVVRRLGTCRLVTVAAPAYLQRHGRPRRPADLAVHACLTYTGGTPRNAWRFTTGGRVETVDVRSVLQSSNGDVLAEAAARGLGITVQPDFIAESYLASGRVVELLADHPPPPYGLYAVLTGVRQVPYRVRLLIEFLAERLSGQDPGAGDGRAATSRGGGAQARRGRPASRP